MVRAERIERPTPPDVIGGSIPLSYAPLARLPGFKPGTTPMHRGALYTELQALGTPTRILAHATINDMRKNPDSTHLDLNRCGIKFSFSFRFMACPLAYLAHVC